VAATPSCSVCRTPGIGKMLLSVWLLTLGKRAGVCMGAYRNSGVFIFGNTNVVLHFKQTLLMKLQVKKWTLRLTATALLISGFLLIIILNPILTYANKTTHNNFTVFHNKTIDTKLLTKLDQATEFLKVSEFYNPKLHLDICLNDGLKYSKLIRNLRGQAFAWGFYDKVVLQGVANYQDNYIELNGYKWNLTQLLAHEMTHCLQFDKLGFWKSNPVANIPNWKWEGYAEYVSRKDTDQKDLSKNLARLFATKKSNWQITFADSTISPRKYYESWAMVQYCMNIKKMTYKKIIDDTTKEQSVRQEMINWYENNKNECTTSYWQ
jgi:hypothetical protein